MWQEIHDFLNYQKTLGRTDKTIKAHRQRLDYFRSFCQSFKIKDIRNVTLGIIRKYHDALIKRELTISTRIAYMSTISYFFYWAYENRYILTNIADRVELPEPDETLPPTPLTENEVIELLKIPNIKSFAGKRNKAMLEMMYGCGLRCDEVLKINLGDVDFKTKRVMVQGKGQKERMVPINDTALNCIAQYLQVRKGKPRKKSPLFATVNGKRLTQNNISALFYALNKAFTRHVNPHLLRHTCACHLLKHGADVRHVQSFLGHANIDTTAKYLGLVKQDLKLAYDRAIEQILAG